MDGGSSDSFASVLFHNITTCQFGHKLGNIQSVVMVDGTRRIYSLEFMYKKTTGERKDKQVNIEMEP